MTGYRRRNNFLRRKQHSRKSGQTLDMPDALTSVNKKLSHTHKPQQRKLWTKNNNGTISKGPPVMLIGKCRFGQVEESQNNESTKQKMREIDQILILVLCSKQIGVAIRHVSLPAKRPYPCQQWEKVFKVV